MDKRAPSIGRIAIAVGFALSCFGLALFLWLAFGGPVPLKPEGYQIEVPFSEATQLAQESDVRISGVSVGKVKRIDLDDAGDAVATLELQAPFAPIPSDARAILRQKTLLGETYVELTPGSNEAPPLAEGAQLPLAQVAESVQLDEIFRAFDPRTRAAFQTWLQSAAVALRGRGQDLSTALASLDSFAAEADDALRVLDSQELAVRELISGGGEVFGALSERQGQLSGLIRNTNTVFETTARRNADLEALFVVLPTFLRESRSTLTRLDEFAADANPVVNQLRPSARELGPTLQATAALATQLEPFFAGLQRVIDASPTGFPALRRLLDDDLPPLLARFEPFLDELTPILTVLRKYRREVTAALGNLTAATNAINDEGGGPANYLRTIAPLNPEALAAYAQRLISNRTNPYIAPGEYKLLQGLKSFEVSQCASGINPSLDGLIAADPDFNDRVDGDVAAAQDLYDRIREFFFAEQGDAASIPKPGCTKQAAFKAVGGLGGFSDYLHVQRLEGP